METKFADLHCHPHMRSFNWLHNPKKPIEKSKYHPWWLILPKFKASEEGRRASAYSQCDMAHVMNGNLKLVFASLYPMEKGWVTGRDNLIKGRVVDLHKMLGNNAFNDFTSDLLSLVLKPFFFKVGQDKGKMIAMRDFAQAVYMKLPLRKINFYQSEDYDYWHELNEERKYLLKRNAEPSETEIFIPWLKSLFVNKKKLKREHPDTLDAQGTYVIAKNGEHIKKILNEGNTAFVMTIEGANVFNSHEPLSNVLKKVELVKDWEEPVFFITFTHHFYNFLAGQAHSLPDIGNVLIDQSKGLKEGFTPEGREVIRYMLSLDKDNNYKPNELKRRILIDVKHMNAISRSEFYREIIEPCLEKGDKIPVLASHVAYSGRETQMDMITDMDNEKDGFTASKNGHAFNAWNINVCDEDVLIIFKTGGLIGINFDQRVLGVAKEDLENEEKHVFYIWQNMKACMMTVLNSTDNHLPPKEDVVNLVCIGTDFDGYIDPVNKYPTVLEFDQFRKDLIKVITHDPDKDKLLFNKYTPEDLADKICFNNAYDFVVKNFT
jgi:microsomal dipeptidase-like Zn-dependent dipeptidase